MKKLLLPVLLLSALALSGATVPAVAVEASPVAVVESVESVAIVADSGAVLAVAEPVVETVAAPVVVEPVVEASPEPVAVATTAPATTGPVADPVAPVTTVEPVATAPATTAPTCPADWYKFANGECVDPATAGDTSNYPAPPPTYTCMEDQPCWDCTAMGNDICGNPACKALNQFTIDQAGTCANAPVGFTEDQVRAEGREIAAKLGRGYILSGSNSQMQRREGFTYIESEKFPSTTHVFS